MIDVDLENFFGSIDHGELLQLLRLKIRDERFIRYLVRLFKAGILTDGECQMNVEGVVQGSCVSPILANIMGHYVIDTWMETTVQAHCEGCVKLFRYGDDCVICCQYDRDAHRIQTALEKRLARYRLRLNAEKTKRVDFDRTGDHPGCFDFLGFTIHWGRSRQGHRIPKVKTNGRRLRAKLKQVNDWAKSARHRGDTRSIWQRFCRKLQGHIQYYGVSFNSRAVSTFICHATRTMFRWLNRRSHKRSFTWTRFQTMIARYPLPRYRVYHRLF